MLFRSWHQGARPGAEGLAGYGIGAGQGVWVLAWEVEGDWGHDPAKWEGGWGVRFGRGWGGVQWSNIPHPPQIYIYLRPHCVILFGNTVFAYVIKVKIEMRSCWIRLGPKSNQSVLRSRNEHTETPGRFVREDVREMGEEGHERLHVKREAEMRAWSQGTP